MVPVILRTSAGDYVATVHVPDFRPQAEVLTWGVRTFVRSDLLSPGPLVYREVFAYCVPTIDGLPGSPLA